MLRLDLSISVDQAVALRMCKKLTPAIKRRVAHMLADKIAGMLDNTSFRLEEGHNCYTDTREYRIRVEVGICQPKII